MAAAKHRRTAYEEGSLDQYLRDISAYPLITREDEVELAQRIRVHDQEALDKLVRSNLRFVVSVAKKYQNQGVALSDLINEGNLGLIRAAHKFDETKGIKFISYAVWWIRQAILQALAEQSRIVRVPLNRAGTLHRIGKRASSLLQELGREPTHEEIAEGMDITEEEVAKTMSISQTHLSLDAPLTPGEDNRLLDYLADTINPTPDELTFEKALTETVVEALAGLKERESKILRLYFGLDGEEPMTLEQIGSLMGITRERVRQIKEKALSRLRHVSRARALESYLGCRVPPTSSFDVTTGVDLQEVDNAVNQAQKEIAQRYDFKGTKVSLEFNRATSILVLIADDDFRMRALFDVLQEKLIKRGVSVKNLTIGEIKPAGGDTVRREITLKTALDGETAKKIAAAIKDAKLKKVQAAIQGEQVRVTSPSRDDLQGVIALLRGQDFGVELKFGNFR